MGTSNTCSEPGGPEKWSQSSGLLTLTEGIAAGGFVFCSCYVTTANVDGQHGGAR